MVLFLQTRECSGNTSRAARQRASLLEEQQTGSNEFLDLGAVIRRTLPEPLDKARGFGGATGSTFFEFGGGIGASNPVAFRRTLSEPLNKALGFGGATNLPSFGVGVGRVASNPEAFRRTLSEPLDKARGFGGATNSKRGFEGVEVGRGGVE